ncbi:hypothetical protein F1D05_22535 [Kribbella qitaiheensis]|uniref:Cell envelope biogenesis protein OmpA n=1 Tax=Kribbella qitaiheensis TaxID=1544730 RepID=A0A7G6X1R4_9ACTN|nr:DUF6069 family protein [Kribbella qitaiheensis]QNE20179.1 hypothetical protein F1D05_22535 [Kribbella qitaiheensis]
MTMTRTATPRSGSLAKTGFAAAAIATVATSVVAAVGHAAGISLDKAGEPIPVAGFATLTALFSLVGLAPAAVLARKARSPRRAFVRTTIALTFLSFVPDLLSDTAPATKALLMFAHVVAAAIVIPAVARRLRS